MRDGEIERGRERYRERERDGGGERETERQRERERERERESNRCIHTKLTNLGRYIHTQAERERE